MAKEFITEIDFLRQCKDEGNEYFKVKNFHESIICYSKGLNNAEVVDVIADEYNNLISILYSNRSASYLALNEFQKAKVDAEMSIFHDINNIKAYYRLGKALQEQKEYTKALKSINDGIMKEKELKLKNGDKLTALEELKNVITNIKSKSDNLLNKKTKGKFRNVFNVKSNCEDVNCNNHLNCKPVKEVKSEDISMPDDLTILEKRMFYVLKDLINKIKTKNLNIFHGFQGTFKKLLDEESFSHLLFPGMSKESLVGVPKNLTDLLSWDKIKFDYQKICKNAAEVLENVKSKGRAQGEIMDNESETVLIPQILHESFGREIVHTIHVIGKRISKLNALYTAIIAPVDSIESSYDQLDDSSINDLLNHGISVQSEYMTREWSKAILLDVQRFVTVERLSPSTNHINGVMLAWIDQERCQQVYPCLHVLTEQLYCLPYEINKKTASKLSLLSPTNGNLLLAYYPKDSYQQRRVDSVLDEVRDSGIRITCAYHLCEGIDSHTNFIYSSESSDRSMVPMIHDTLTMHQSLDIYNETDSAKYDYFVIYYFIHA